MEDKMMDVSTQDPRSRLIRTAYTDRPRSHRISQLKSFAEQKRLDRIQTGITSSDTGNKLMMMRRRSSMPFTHRNSETIKAHHDNLSNNDYLFNNNNSIIPK